jgi:ribosomal peptide maturation radical SAM protein 1
VNNLVPDVALASMPFGPVFSPSIGLSLLQAELAAQQLTARVHYFTIPFAEAIGQAFYSGIAEDGRPAMEDLAGEWLFSKAVFDTTTADEARYVKELLEEYYSNAMIARLLRARERIDSFLDECVETLMRDRPRIVGFTSVFQQHTASLALARRLKRASPSTFVVFGGANCEGVMGAETVRSFPYVDAAVSGEADLVFPDLVRRVLDGVSVSGLPGVRTRDRAERDLAFGNLTSSPMVRDMDSLPQPDYRDYFDQFKASRFDRDWQPSVFLETSRGCWWGERMHCTFCGLNGATMAFRSKSPARAVDEVTALARRHPDCDIQAVDNIIDLGYFKNVLPAIAARALNVGLFYETKSNLNKHQVRLLRAAGVRDIQPGIESFSDTVLKLMRKGVTGLQNIQLLKWCQEFGVAPAWNFLWGFPGEPPEEYERMARLIPQLAHLPPPVAQARIRLDRFSPNFFDAERLGFKDLKPFPAYAHVYPLDGRAVANLASYFTYEYQEPRDVDGYTRSLSRELDKWKRPANQGDLFSLEAGERLVIVDFRPVSRAPLTLIGGLERLLYRECDAVRDLSQLVRAAAECGPAPSPDALEQALQPLVDRGLVLREGSRYLALAIPLGEYTPSAATRRRFSSLIRRLGAIEGDRWIVPTTEAESAPRARRNGCRGTVPPLTTSRFSVDAQGRLVIQASDNPQQRKER